MKCSDSQPGRGAGKVAAEWTAATAHWMGWCGRSDGEEAATDGVGVDLGRSATSQAPGTQCGKMA